MFAGIKINISGEDYIVPPISLGQLRNGALSKLREHDALVAEEKTFEAMILRGEIICEALQRNYPDFEPQKLFDWLDMGNVGQVWLSVLGASGFTPGETGAATRETNGISAPSTEASPQLTDGPILK